MVIYICDACSKETIAVTDFYMTDPDGGNRLCGRSERVMLQLCNKCKRRLFEFFTKELGKENKDA